MKFKINQKIRIIILAFILLCSILNIPVLNSFLIQNNNVSEIKNDEAIHTSAEIHYSTQWLKNPNFETNESWNAIKEGDETDFQPEISGGEAKYFVLGDQRTFSNISGIPQQTDWINVTNPIFPALPDLYEIDAYGCHVSHLWVDPIDPFQTTCVHWDRTITLPVDMSDYIITSTSVDAIFNASVTTESGNNPGGSFDYLGVDTPADSPDQPEQFDYTKFYVLISDLEKSVSYEIAYNQTVNLGQDILPEISNITDTNMRSVQEESLIFYLTSVLEKDPLHRSLIITLGIRIQSADNYNYDRDSWDSLRIKSCDLNFTYEKKMNQFTSMSWKQEAEAISNDTNIQITEANFRFEYKIDQSWPKTLSPNSDLRIYINNKLHTETVKLSTAKTSLEQAKPGGFDVTSLISKGIKINVSIQVFLADNFLLNRTIIISIDNVFLDISFILFTDDIVSEPLLFRMLFIVALVVAIGLGGYLYIYQKILKYPKPVRKVRNYRFSLKRKKAPNVNIIKRESAFKTMYLGEISRSSRFLKVKPTEHNIKPEKTTKKPPEK